MPWLAGQDHGRPFIRYPLRVSARRDMVSARNAGGGNFPSAPMMRSIETVPRLAWFTVGPALLWMLAFFAVPFLALALMSLWSLTASGIDHTLSLSNYVSFFIDDRYLQALVNSLEVAFTVTILSVLLAYPFAWFLAEQVPRRWQWLALGLAVLPFWTSYVVRSYAWMLVLADEGVMNQTLLRWGFTDAPIQLASTRLATVVGFVHVFVMLLSLTIYASLKQLSASHRRDAADLGANPLQVFFHVVLPLTLPGVAVGAFFTFVLAIGDYITPQILGSSHDLLMPKLIMMQVVGRGDLPFASALCLLLMVVVSIAYLICARWLKLERA